MRLSGWYRSRSGFILPLALVFLFILLLLEVGLISLQQVAEENALDESSRMTLLYGSQEVYTSLGESIETGQRTGPAGIDGDINYLVPHSELQLTAKWDGKNSLNRSLPTLWANFPSIFNRDPDLPEFSYFPDKEENSLPIGHTRLELTNTAEKEKRSVTVFSHTFPYGLYAPKGQITAAAISSFSNPVEYESDQPIIEETGRPVDLRAGNGITVTDSYSSGRAITSDGSVSLPEGDDKSPGAIGFSGRPPAPDPWEQLFDDLTNRAEDVSNNCLDKTEFLDDEVFTLEHLKQIFSGDAAALESIFGVGQACKVPFFPIPAVQDDALLYVFYILHPYPVDFSGTARSGDLSREIKEKTEELQKQQDELAEKQKELADEQSKSKPDQSKIDDLKDQISDLQDQIKVTKQDIDDLEGKLDEEAKNINNQISQAKVPETGTEDAEQVTKGWAYTFILSDLLNIVLDLIKGKNPFDAIFVPTRVVHFGGSGPGWKWGSDSIDMKANLTVPRGRTLHLGKSEITVHGDIYLQEGACLKVQGNLNVAVPDDWKDFKGVTASDYGGYPAGRIILEEGATLVVGGNLNVEGGNSHEGSIQLTSEYAPSKALTRLVRAGGDVTLKHGISPSVKLGDLVDALADKDESLKGFNDDFFRPLVEQVFPVIGKLPYVGPWQWRKSWFASYATTFEFIPFLEEFGLGGPWPIPLPFDNCLVKVFNYLSIIYSVELNAFTGENFYTLSLYWPFGRGVTPVFMKVNPELMREELKGLDWEKISIDAVYEEFRKFLSDDMPKFAANVIQNIITEVIEQAVRSAIPFNPPSCGSKENNEAKEIKEVAEEFLKDALKEFGGIVKRSFQKILLSIKNEVYNNLDGNDPKYSIMRQLPGVVVCAGGRIDSGVDSASRLTLGLLIARQSVRIESKQTVGAVISLEGDVEVQGLLHYPYYDRVSLYNPKKPGNIFDSIVELTDPEGVPGGDVGRNFARIIAQGIIE